VNKDIFTYDGEAKAKGRLLGWNEKDPPDVQRVYSSVVVWRVW
jgi:hypothetical protein